MEIEQKQKTQTKHKYTQPQHEETNANRNNSSNGNSVDDCESRQRFKLIALAANPFGSYTKYAEPNIII